MHADMVDGEDDARQVAYAQEVKRVMSMTSQQATPPPYLKPAGGSAAAVRNPQGAMQPEQQQPQQAHPQQLGRDKCMASPLREAGGADADDADADADVADTDDEGHAAAGGNGGHSIGTSRAALHPNSPCCMWACRAAVVVHRMRAGRGVSCQPTSPLPGVAQQGCGGGRWARRGRAARPQGRRCVAGARQN